MITRSLSLLRRLTNEMERHAGSLARLAYFDGVMPANCDGVSDGTRVSVQDLPRGFMLDILYNTEPELPSGATYWRVFDNNGAVVLQGDGKS